MSPVCLIFFPWLGENSTLMKHGARQTTFAVPLSCNDCIKAVSDSLYQLGGISKVQGDLQNQIISVEGVGESFIICRCEKVN